MLLKQLLNKLRQETSLNLSRADVDRAVRQRLRLLRSADREAYLHRALTHCDNNEFTALIDLLVVPETWFFRDPAVMAAAVRIVEERLAQGKAPVRILSLPCSTGEEPYTIAMALLDAGIDRSCFSIDAVDLSHAAICHAQKGQYTNYAFRSQDLRFRDRYFTPAEATYVLRSDVRETVHFSQGNLLGDKPGAHRAPYDIVFCRNLLIYFDEPRQRQALYVLNSLLAEDGWLFTAYAELFVCSRQVFDMHPVHDVYALRNASRGRRRDDAGNLRRIQAEVMPLGRPSQAWHTGSVTTPPLPANEISLDQARRLADRDKIDEAARAYATILKAHPDSQEAAFMLALLSERQSRPHLAETYFKRAVYLDPDHYEALCHLALLAEQRGDTETGAAYRRRAARVYRRQQAGALTK